MLVHRDPVPHPLYLVTPVFNPARFQTRWSHYKDFAKRAVDAGFKVITVEAALGQRDFAVKDLAPHGDGHQYIPLRVTADSELWLKENLQNIGVSRMPHDWQYVAFVDADMAFADPDIVDKTLHALQHNAVVQMFSHCMAAGPTHVPLSTVPSFGYTHVHGLREPQPAEHSGAPAGKGVFGAPGGAWAWRRDAFEAVGRLIDFAVLGAADHYMALALIGDVDSGLSSKFSKGYCDPIRAWQKRAIASIKGNIGYVDGTIWHYWHGSYTSRRYDTRSQILVRNSFDPSHDLKYDWQSVIALTGDKPRLRDDIRMYFHERNEDEVQAPARDYRLVAPKPAPDWSKP